LANLIIWRHAEAEDHSVGCLDTDRKLTKKGQKDAEKMAKWLNVHLPSNTKVLCSPAKRCLETAIFLQQLNNHELNVADFLSADSTVENIANNVINDDSAKTLLIVGHQPNLGLLIAKLLGMNENSCVVKKCTVWWLKQRHSNGAMQTYLFTVQHPAL